MAGWRPSHHLFLHAPLLGKSYGAIWVVRTLIILPQMGLPTTNKLCFSLVCSAISDMMHIMH